MNKIEMAKHLQTLVSNVDENAFIRSDDKFYWINNKTALLNISSERLAKRSRKESLEFMIRLYSKYQKEEN